MATTKKTTATDVSTKAVAAPPAVPKVVPAAVAKTVAKAPSKPVAKRSAPLAKVAAKPPVKPLAPAKADKPAKVKKPKLVRDSFTIPKTEYIVLDELKQRAGKLEISVKKSELLRAGIKALAALSDLGLLAALNAVPTIKTGRPAKNQAR
jgi:hypothetical protein